MTPAGFGGFGSNRSGDAGDGARAREREEAERVVITDKRKVDRSQQEGPAAEQAAGTSAGTSAGAAADAGGETPVDAAAPEAAAAEQAPDENAALLAERTADLQRLQAEYANYRRRADRERAAAGELAVGRALTSFLPVLDDLERARAHGDLTGGLKAVADKLEAVFSSLGLVAFGAVGDPFDPSIHEAVMHDESAEVSEPTCTTVMRPGYRHGERLLRPAMVGVSDPAAPDSSGIGMGEAAGGPATGSDEPERPSDGEAADTGAAPAGD